MATLKKDGRVFTSSEKQIYLFELLLDKINGRTIQCSFNTNQRVEELLEQFKSGKLSISTIKRKASTQSQLVVDESRREFIFYFDGKNKIIENDLHLPKDKGIKQYYLVLPLKAKQYINRIFTSGIRSKEYGSLYITNPMVKCKNYCVVELYLTKSDVIKVQRNLFDQSSTTDLQEGLYYKDEIIPIKNIVKIQYEQK